MKALTILLMLLYQMNVFGQEVSENPDESPEFPGGSIAFRKYLVENMKYPQDALDRGVTGKCYVSFVVDTNGVCTDFKVIKGIPDCPSCDQEAFRLVKLMPKWKPGLRNGRPSPMLYRVPIVFKAY
ncbi:Gram-negative bacterial tonB protein [compost metagenome]